MFRDKSPYSFPGGISNVIVKNAVRVAEVWMDKWRDFYYEMNPGTAAGCSDLPERAQDRRCGQAAPEGCSDLPGRARTGGVVRLLRRGWMGTDGVGSVRWRRAD